MRQVDGTVISPYQRKTTVKLAVCEFDRAKIDCYTVITLISEGGIQYERNRCDDKLAGNP